MKNNSSGAHFKSVPAKKEKKNSQAPAAPSAGDPIADYLKTVRFKRSIFGGVDEADVFKKLAALQQLYEAQLALEREKYQSLVAELAKAAVPAPSPAPAPAQPPQEEPPSAEQVKYDKLLGELASFSEKTAPKGSPDGEAD